MIKDLPEPAAGVRGRHTGQVAVALASVVLAVAGGAALDPAALGIGAAASSGVVAPERVTTVGVVASQMRFVPSPAYVPPDSIPRGSPAGATV